MNGQRRSESANQNKDSGQKVEEPDDFKVETLPLQPRRSSGDFQCLLNDIVGTANCINGLRLSDIIENLSDIAVALDFDAIDFQQDIAGLNAGKFRGSVTYNQLGLYDSLIGLDPGTAIVRGIPFSLLSDVEPTKDQESNAEQRYENKSEGNDFPVIRNGY